MQVEREISAAAGAADRGVVDQALARRRSPCSRACADVEQWQAAAAQFSADPAWDSLDPKSRTSWRHRNSSSTWSGRPSAPRSSDTAAAADNAERRCRPRCRSGPTRSASAVASRRPPLPPWTRPSSRAWCRPPLPPRGSVPRRPPASRVLPPGAQLQSPLAKLVSQLRAALKQHGHSTCTAEVEAQVQAALAQAGELEGWQRWRADQLREELIAALTQAPEGQRPGGRKIQETLRALRGSSEEDDRPGRQFQPRAAKKFDEACNQAHKLVEVWIARLKEQGRGRAPSVWPRIDEPGLDCGACRQQRLKAQLRELHGFSERWRQSGHVSEKLHTELQLPGSVAMQAAHARPGAAQVGSIARRHALIEEAIRRAAPAPRIDVQGAAAALAAGGACRAA